jgi:hypothetical protein
VWVIAANHPFIHEYVRNYRGKFPINFQLNYKSQQNAYRWYRFRFQIHTMKHAILRIILTIQAKILCRLTADMQSPRSEDRFVLGVIALSFHSNRVIRHARLALAITRVNMQSYKQTAGLPLQRLAFQHSPRLADGIVLNSWSTIYYGSTNSCGALLVNFEVALRVLFNVALRRNGGALVVESKL